MTFNFAATALRITEETFLALATNLMIASIAFGISTAHSSTIAQILAACSTIVIDDAILIRLTVGVLTAQVLFHADVIQTKLKIGASGIVFAGGLANAAYTQLISNAITIR